MTAAIAALLASSASRAVLASRITLSDKSARSGATAASPSPVTMILGGGCVWADAAGGRAIAAARPSAIIILFMNVSGASCPGPDVGRDYGLIAAGAGPNWMRRRSPEEPAKIRNSCGRSNR